jgi:hypothetical protein
MAIMEADMEKLCLVIDVVARMSCFAMAKTFDADTVDSLLDGIEDDLVREYDKDDVKTAVESYRKPVMEMASQFKNKR